LTATFYYRGYGHDSTGVGFYHYDVLCDNGVVFRTKEHEYISTGTRLVLQDDACMPDSGDITWQCGVCGMVWEVRTRPTATVTCPRCSTQEQIPEGLILNEEDEDS